MAKRQLTFGNLDEVVAEIDRLHRDGYEQVGKWDLAQICWHLSFFVRGAVEGFELKAPWIIRAVLGRRMLKKILAGEAIKEGVKIPDIMRPGEGLDEAEEIAKFKELIERFKKAEKLYPSGFFGKLTREQWEKLTLYHCAHHLGFLTAKQD
ncbi:MAG: DUF1569 domain-containing protein [Sedimentisphaerales bacterium]|nr:DUF1569 domain-containing protein [Sedimentisphaerales bacterium]